MMKMEPDEMRVLVVVGLLITLAFGQANPSKKAAELLYPATYVLYQENSEGGFSFVCTAMAFESRVDDEGYNLVRFASAGHCVSSPKNDLLSLFGPPSSSSSESSDGIYAITDDEPGSEKLFMHAEVLHMGGAKEDFAVLEVRTRLKIPIMPLGVDPVDAFDEPLINVAAPGGAGKQIFRGRVTRVSINHHLGSHGSNWYHMMLIEVPGTNSGSSGSPIVCVNQQAVCGFILGTINSTSMVAAPVSLFRTWYARVQKPKSKPKTPEVPHGPAASYRTADHQSQTAQAQLGFAPQSRYYR